MEETNKEAPINSDKYDKLLQVRIDSETEAELNSLVKIHGCTKSYILRNMIRNEYQKSVESNIVKTSLVNAHRYYDVRNIIKGILSRRDEITLPVDPYPGQNNTFCDRIDTATLCSEAEKLMSLIDGTDESIENARPCEFNALRIYTNTMSDMMLHNYAVSFTHNCVPKISIERIRSWLTLKCVIDYFIYDDEEYVDIPNSWKRSYVDYDGMAKMTDGMK